MGFLVAAAAACFVAVVLFIVHGEGPAASQRTQSRGLVCLALAGFFVVIHLLLPHL